MATKGADFKADAAAAAARYACGMTRLFLIGLLLLLSGPVPAAEIAPAVRSSVTTELRALPYPREPRAAAVWNERTCWSQCGSYCAWGMAACLRQEKVSQTSQGTCLKLTDRCDRKCQRDCRTAGGPLLPDVFDFLN
jgi:hypothetical protein